MTPIEHSRVQSDCAGGRPSPGAALALLELRELRVPDEELLRERVDKDVVLLEHAIELGRLLLALGALLQINRFERLDFRRQGNQLCVLAARLSARAFAKNDRP